MKINIRQKSFCKISNHECLLPFFCERIVIDSYSIVWIEDV